MHLTHRATVVYDDPDESGALTIGCATSPAANTSPLARRVRLPRQSHATMVPATTGRERGVS